MPTTRQQHQGDYGEAFVFAMASAAGLLVSKSNLDVDGIDWLIGYPGPLGQARSPKIEVQVKTWSAPKPRPAKPTVRKARPAVMAAAPPAAPEGDWRYSMKVSHFNQLAGPGFAVSRYLVLVTVPADADRYAVCDAECMRLHHAAYWVSLANKSPLPVGPDEAKTVTVSVPRGNLLTPKALLALLDGDQEGSA